MIGMPVPLVDGPVSSERAISQWSWFEKIQSLSPVDPNTRAALIELYGEQAYLQLAARDAIDRCAV